MCICEDGSILCGSACTKDAAKTRPLNWPVLQVWRVTLHCVLLMLWVYLYTQTNGQAMDSCVLRIFSSLDLDLNPGITVFQLCDLGKINWSLWASISTSLKQDEQKSWVLLLWIKYNIAYKALSKVTCCKDPVIIVIVVQMSLSISFKKWLPDLKLMVAWMTSKTNMKQVQDR
jgi:hypothetical protein